MLRKILVMAAAAASVTILSGIAHAWPDKPIRLIVPFNAGGNTDILARTIQKVVAEKELLTQPVTVLNVGGHYSIGAQQVLDATPDGSTFMLMHSALLSAEASGVLQFGYKDFSPVAATGQFCQIPTVREDSEFQSLDDLLTIAREAPNEIIFGVNIGGNNHMAAIALQNAESGAAFRFAQIGGGAANYSALTGGHIQVAIFTGSEYDNYKSSGLRALAYMGSERLANLPDLPTAVEAGYDVTSCITNYWFAPADTPQEAIDGFADMLEQAVSSNEMGTYFENTFTAPVFIREPALAEQLDAEYRLIEPVARMAKPAEQ